MVSAAALALTLSGCGTQTDSSPAYYGPAGVDDENVHMARVKLYPSLNSLAKDSVLIATGTVTEQNVVADLDPTTEFTLSSFDISDVQSSNGSITTDSVVTVRELGSVTLETGNTYLLYLTASGLEGELAAHYYVTGANAGIFEAEDEGSAKANPKEASFKKVHSEEGESLPERVKGKDAKG